MTFIFTPYSLPFLTFSIWQVNHVVTDDKCDGKCAVVLGVTQTAIITLVVHSAVAKYQAYLAMNTHAQVGTSNGAGATIW